MDTATWSAGLRRRLVPIALLLSLTGLFMCASPVLAAPSITLSPSSGGPGTVVTISGALFDSYKSDNLYVLFDGTQIQGSPIEVPDSGSFSIDFTVPVNATAGTHEISVRQAPDSIYLIADAFFNVESTRLLIDLGSGPAGTSVTLTGSGFHAGVAVSLYYSNPASAQIATVTASNIGRFTYNYVIPYGTAGDHTISASNSVGNNAQTRFIVTPHISLNSVSGGPGELVNISGNGFSFRSNVTITMGTKTITTARTDDLGSFDLNFNVPDLKANLYEVRAQDSAGNTDVIEFTVTAGVKLSTTIGGVGSKLTVSGSGFIAGSNITIKFGEMTTATPKADSNGSFSGTFTVPALGTGEHIVRITDGATVRELIYTIESDPPPAPVLLLPVEGSVTRVYANFEWEEVTDASIPVVYHLQVSSDENFSSIRFEKEVLAETSYTLGEGEALPTLPEGTAYYWRVRATDGAGTTGEWSGTWSMNVAAPQVPLLIPLIEPEEGEEPIITVEEAILLDWQDVLSTGGAVTYTLELSTEADFAEALITQSDLKESEYRLSDEEMESLSKNVSYYWRIKATDTDGVESGWSAADRFIIGGSSFSWPGWATWLIVAIVVIGVGAGAYLFGRRKAYEEIQ